MRMPAWIMLLLFLASIGCRSSAKKTEEDTHTRAVSVTKEAVASVSQPVAEIPATVVEVVPLVTTPDVPLTPEEEAEVARLDVQIAALEKALAEGQSEIQETLTRLRANREKKIGRIRTDLKTAVDAFEDALREVRLVKGGEHHGE